MLIYHHMKIHKQITFILLLFCINVYSQKPLSAKEFKTPALKYHPRPLYFWNNATVIADTVVAQMQNFRDKCGYGGFGILAYGKNFKPEYLSNDYFKVYGAALAKAKALGLTMCLYDEFGFPSGSGGAFNADGVPRFKNKYPQHTIKRLDKTDTIVIGSSNFRGRIPAGKVMAVVAMETTTKQLIDLTNTATDSIFSWMVPAGEWRLMFFRCVADRSPIADYLDPTAVKCFIEMTHEAYYARFKDYFGTTIDGTFFDEPTMYRANGRIWTGNFNLLFEKKYGYSPAKYYPALWYDIGEQTQAARNLLFGFRTELYATAFTKEVNDWSLAHGVTATGHQDQEEILNPVSVAGDLMKCFKYLEIPGIDKIGGKRPAERFYKVVSSAAYNWDHTLIMSETYGAMGDLEWDSIYSIALDQYAKGINNLIPHAVWYDTSKVTYKPELSYRHRKYANQLPEFNHFLARLNLLLQPPGRHVADIAVLYPIQTLQGEHYLDGPVIATYGGVQIPKTDYANVANWITEASGKDYTYIHPEVLDERCTVENGNLLLANKINAESFKVMILPSCKTMSINNLQKVKQFYDQGGKVIFTTQLPSKSAEPDKDNTIKSMVNYFFPNLPDRIDSSANQIVSNRNAKGGKVLYIQYPNYKNITSALSETVENPDVEMPGNTGLRYIHKVVNGKNLYLIANIGEKQFKGLVKLKGKLRLEVRNPHNGTISRPSLKYVKIANTDYTEVSLSLDRVRSIFLVEK